MTTKRNSHSSVISVEDENLDILDFESDKDEEDDEDDYIETDLGTDNINSRPSGVSKYIKDGHLYIICDGKTYNAQGLEVK